MLKIKVLALAAIIAVGLFVYKHHQTEVTQTTQKAVTTARVEAAKTLASHCKTNTLSQQVIVSISERHMWACSGATTSYDAPVVTGMEMYPEDLTPPGTYTIYAKTTDVNLSGSDSTGSWDDPVKYWMPFLDNQYGTYGFHDATWRADKEFGKIDPNSKDASHGCVEMPLAAMRWLYNWAPVGTTVTVES